MALSNVRAAMRAAKNAVMQFSDIEVKVREATSNDPWGPTSTLMAEIARATNDYQQYPQLFHRLWQRLNDVEHVMHVQKALILVDYLLRNGAERFINDAKRRARDIAQLKRFKHYDANNNDDAKEARNKAKLVYDLLMNDKQLAEERQKAKKISDVKSQGFGSSADHFTSDPYGRRYDDNSDDRYGSGGSSYYSNGNSGGDVPEKRAAASSAGRSSAPSNDEPFETHDVDDWTKETGEERKRRDSGASAEKGDESEKKKKKKKKVVKDKAAANTVEEVAAKKEEEEAAPEPEEHDADDADQTEKKKKKKGDKKKKKKDQESENGDIRRPSGDFGSDPFATKPSSSSSAAVSSSTADPFSGNSNGNGSNRSAAAAYTEFLTRQSSGGVPPGSSDDFLSKLAAQGGLVSPASGFKSPDSNHLYEHDFLTGGSGGATITDMFANASISNNRSPSASPTLSFQQSSTPEQSRPLVFDEMAAQQQQAAAAQNADLWHAAADLTNLDNITEQERRARKKEPTNDNAMSMAMMRSIQPLGAEKHSVVVPPPVATSAPFAGGASSTALVVSSPQPYAAGYPPPPYGYGASAPGYAMPPLGAPMPVYPSGYGYGYPGGQPGYGSPFPAPPPQTPIRTAPHYGGAPSINQQTKTNIPIFDVPKAQPTLQNNNNNAFNGLTWK